MSIGAVGVNPVDAAGAGIRRARRKFFELHAANASSIALEAIQRIKALYEIGRWGKQLDTENRKSLRFTEATPPLVSMKAWLARRTGCSREAAHHGQ